MPDTVLSIASQYLSADIAPLGAQLFALRDGSGRDLLWDGNPAIWSGRAPILFPIVGELAKGQYRLGNRTYRLPRHGLARHRPFTLGYTTAKSLTFKLLWDNETLRDYPFRFELEIGFAVENSTLGITALVKNLDDGVMPASFGFHPAFRWPLPYNQSRASHRILFEQAEPAPIRRLDADGLVQELRFSTPVNGETLALRDDLFTADALIFDSLSSRRLSYGAETGPHLQIDFPDTPRLGIWSKPGANFVAIEPWHGVADPQDFDGDFRDKPGIFLLPPGGSLRCRMAITFCGMDI